MIRLPLRLAGYFLIAAGFASLVIDGTVSVLAGTIKLTSMAQMMQKLAPERFQVFRGVVETKLGRLIWESGLVLLELPAFALLMGIGLSLVFAGRRPRPQIGFDPRP